MEELEKQNNEWLAIRKMVHRRARIELDNIYIYYMRRLKELRKMQSQRDAEVVKNNKRKN